MENQSLNYYNYYGYRRFNVIMPHVLIIIAGIHHQRGKTLQEKGSRAIN